MNENEPVPTGDLTEPHEWMTDSQKAGWTYAIEHAPRGLLKKLDRSVLAVWAVAEDLHRQACQKVEQFGILTKAANSGVPIQSPYLPVVNKQAQLMLKAVELLGFSPVSRTRIQIVDDLSPDEEDEWDALDRLGQGS